MNVGKAQLTGSRQGHQSLLYLTDKFPKPSNVSKHSVATDDRRKTDHMAAQPSASWKLSAMSAPLCSVHTMSVSTNV